jgi:hypothetical protein
MASQRLVIRKRLRRLGRAGQLDEALEDPRISDTALGGTWFPEMEPA